MGCLICHVQLPGWLATAAAVLFAFWLGSAPSHCLVGSAYQVGEICVQGTTSVLPEVVGTHKFMQVDRLGPWCASGSWHALGPWKCCPDRGMSLNCLRHCHWVVVGCGGLAGPVCVQQLVALVAGTGVPFLPLPPPSSL